MSSSRFFSFLILVLISSRLPRVAAAATFYRVEHFVDAIVAVAVAVCGSSSMTSRALSRIRPFPYKRSSLSPFCPTSMAPWRLRLEVAPVPALTSLLIMNSVASSKPISSVLISRTSRISRRVHNIQAATVAASLSSPVCRPQQTGYSCDCPLPVQIRTYPHNNYKYVV